MTFNPTTWRQDVLARRKRFFPGAYAATRLVPKLEPAPPPPAPVETDGFSAREIAAFYSDQGGVAAQLIRQIAVAYGLTSADLKGHNRSIPFVVARQVAMAQLRAKLGKSASEIGRLMGDRDHTTVLWAIRQVDADTLGMATAVEARFIELGGTPCTALKSLQPSRPATRSSPPSGRRVCRSKPSLSRLDAPPTPCGSMPPSILNFAGSGPTPAAVESADPLVLSRHSAPPLSVMTPVSACGPSPTMHSAASARPMRQVACPDAPCTASGIDACRSGGRWSALHEAETTRLLLAAEALRLFRVEKLDTVDIGCRLKLHQAEADRLLHEAMEAERAKRTPS